MKNQELTEEQLNIVSGDDYGDTQRDNRDESMYEVGMDVEIYWTKLHLTTHREEIQAKERLDDGTWVYQTNVGKLDADEFERPEVIIKPPHIL